MHIYQLPNLTLLCQRQQTVLPTEWGLVGPLAGLDTFGGNTLPQSAIRTCIMQPYVACSLLTIVFQIPNTDGRTPKCTFVKYGLQLWTTLNKLNTGYGCSLWALYKHSSQQAQWLGNFQVSTENWTKL